MILQTIEKRTAEEKLFHWPLCFDSFRKEEVQSGNWPFPRYENGDIFPTWGYLGIRAYAKYDKNVALKYIRNLLTQYKKDGLSSQRYSRIDQSGQGTDVLAGISTTITALYSDIYGVSPRWNRMGVQPNLIPELNGTRFNYTLRDTVYTFSLNVDDYQISTSGFVVRSNCAFGVGKSENDIIYYPNNEESMKLVQHTKEGQKTDLNITEWTEGTYKWETSYKHTVHFTLYGLLPGEGYTIRINDDVHEKEVANDGSLVVVSAAVGPKSFAVLHKK